LSWRQKSTLEFGVVPEKVNEKSGKMSPQQARLKGHVTGGISPNYFQQHRAINHF